MSFNSPSGPLHEEGLQDSRDGGKTLENQLMCAVDQVRNLQQQSLMEETLERIYIQTQ